MPYMLESLKYVFKHLGTQELLSVARVCSAWNLIAMDRVLVINIFQYLKKKLILNYDLFLFLVAKCTFKKFFGL